MVSKARRIAQKLMKPASLPACPSCAHPDARFIGQLPAVDWFAGTRLNQAIDGGHLFECSRCHLRFRFPLLPRKTYTRLYNQSGVAIWSGTEHRKDWDLIESKLLELKPDAKTLLDYGCHTGGLLERLSYISQRFGVELNAAAAKVAANQTGAILFPDIASLPRNIRFDVITACDVVEHVDDPRALIRDLLALLAPDGQLIITTGDGAANAWSRSGANWWYCFYPEHISFISRAWLSYYEELGDFRVVDSLNFRQGYLHPVRRMWEHFLMVVYRHLPRLLLACARTVRKLRKKGGPASVPGNGVTADHILVILARGPDARHISVKNLSAPTTCSSLGCD